MASSVAVPSASRPSVRSLAPYADARSCRCGYDVGPREALWVDAGTFLIAAVLIRFGVKWRPAAATGSGDDAGLAGWAGRLRTGAAVVFADPRLRALVLLAWLATFSVVPEGLAAPYAALLGGGAGTLGLLLAAEPVGAVAGALLVTRLVAPDRRLRLLVPLAVLSLAPLLGYGVTPGMPFVLALLVLSGLGGSYQLIANTRFMQLVPASSRGQGLGLAAAGAAAEVMSPAYVVAAAGLSGLVLMIPLAGVGRHFAVSSASRGVGRCEGRSWSQQSPGLGV